MNKINQKLEIVGNALLILVTLVSLFILLQRQFFNSSSASELAKPTEQTNLMTDAKILLPNVNFEENEKTLILTLQTGCHFCSESIPFYKKLQETVSGKNIKLVAVFPSGEQESQEYLKNLGLLGIEVRQMLLADLQVTGTPTLILVDKLGKTTNVWIGKLSSEKELEVINRLLS